jgi:hypothetical protein
VQEQEQEEWAQKSFKARVHLGVCTTVRLGVKEMEVEVWGSRVEIVDRLLRTVWVWWVGVCGVSGKSGG